MLIMGGYQKQTRKEGKKKEQQYLNVSLSQPDLNRTFVVSNKVHLLKVKDNGTRFKWKPLAPFPFKKKLGHVVYNGYGRFFCFITDSNSRELPSIVVYDVRKIFPKFDKYHDIQS